MTYRPRLSDWMRVAVVALVLVGWGVAAHSYPITVVSASAPATPAPDRGGAPWPMASHDVGHSGRSPNPGPTTGRLRWIRRLEGNVTPGPVVAADGTIYLASNAGILHALDPATGADIWTVKAEGESGTDLSASPAILDSGVIAWPTSGHAVQGVSPEAESCWIQRSLPPVTTVPPGPIAGEISLRVPSRVRHTTSGSAPRSRRPTASLPTLVTINPVDEIAGDA